MDKRKLNKKISSQKGKAKKADNTVGSKVVRINEGINSQNFIYSNKLTIIFTVFIVLLIVLILRLGFLQFVQGNSLKESAYKQQTINQIISPKRGNIYDSSGTKALAISARVDTVTINPSKIVDKTDEKTKELKEKVAKAFSEIFELDYDSTLAKVSAENQFQYIAKKVEQDKVDKLKTWMKENKISDGINIDEDSKRYYPYDSLASSIIGFCGTDNQGIVGIESKWDDVLTGTPGKIVSSQGSNQQEIPNSEEKYIAPENGSDLTLTIDINVQNIVEKYLKQAVEENNCEGGGNAILMNPKNGDIIAMACYPDYNLNDPFTPNAKLKETYDSIPDDQKGLEIQKMWKNKSVSDLYEPGSVFKVITAAVALEEDITTPDAEGEFLCTGWQHVSDTDIACWRSYNPHGYQSLKEALGNSCNPAFIQLGQKIGVQTLYKYYQAFGLFDKTGVGLSGEENSLFNSVDKVGSVELATMSFGQRLSITPLQMATALCAVSNGGYLMKPRIVKSITNSDTGAVEEIEPVTVRQVISKETSDEVKYMMEYVATEGTGKHALVEGYSIGGKTGTSEPPEDKKDIGYVASYAAISPIEDTQVVLLVTLYKPPAYNHNGGTLAGPVVQQMLNEILPYLNVPSTATNVSYSNEDLTMLPDVRNKTIAEAKNVLEEAGFDVEVVTGADINTELVKDQNPKPGTSLIDGAKIYIYGSDATANSTTVPDLKNMGLGEAKQTLRDSNLNISVEGKGYVISQDYIKDTQVPEGTVISVVLKPILTDAH
ncbi:MAG: PASTA domain-containing protein [Clostridia bacterium]|nr:PASTA domain-containing protein [Clostridia bacterium]